MRDRILAFLVLLPSVLAVGVFVYGFIGQNLWVSLTDWGKDPAQALALRPELRFVGLENYAYLFQDPDFRQALWNTLKFTVVSVSLETVLGLAIALIIHSNFRGRGLVRTAILIPWAIPTVVSAKMWQWMLNDVYGVINVLGVKLGLLSQKVAFLARPELLLPSIIAVDVWKTTPFMALLLLAGLQMIPEELYEAASIDGASRWQQFWSITRLGGGPHLPDPGRPPGL